MTVVMGVTGCLPVANAAVGVEVALGQLLLERVFGYLRLVDLDAQAGSGARADEAAIAFDGEGLRDDVLAPGHVGVDGLADDVGGGREAELQAGGGADRSLRVVRRERNAVGLRHRGDAA